MTTIKALASINTTVLSKKTYNLLKEGVIAIGNVLCQWLTENDSQMATATDDVIVQRVANNVAVVFLDNKNLMESIIFSYTNKGPDVIMYFKGFKNSNEC